MFDPLYPLFSIFSFLGFVLVLIPLPWHFQAWNSGTCFYIMWSALTCLNQFANSVVWADDMINRAPVWCDISIRITLAASVGIPAASLCINRRLYEIASVKTVSASRAEKRRGVLIDALICLLFPLVYVALQYIVQGHRFNIYEQIGCGPAIYNSTPAYFLNVMWPPLIGLISAVYGILSLRAFNRRRAAFAELLSAHNALTTGRYLRLMALSATDILLTTPLGIFVMVLDLTSAPLEPWISFSDTHFDFGRVEQFPAIFWRADHLGSIAIEFTRWVAPATALIFFAFFGFAVEARKNYAATLSVLLSAFWLSAARLGIQRPSSDFAAKSASGTTGTNSSLRGIGYNKSRPSKRCATTEDISLPAYFPTAGTGSFTESFASVADLKRTASLVSQAPSSTTTSSPFAQGFVLEEDERKVGDEEKVMPTQEALPLAPRLHSPSLPPTPPSAVAQHHALNRHLNPETPTTATPFTSTTTTPRNVDVIPLRYPADVHEAEEDAAYLPDSTHNAFSSSPTPISPPSRFSYPQTRHEQLWRGLRSLV